MGQADEISWLDIEQRMDQGHVLWDYGRLKQLLPELVAPDSQYPALCVFLGNKARDAGLRQLYPQNNIRRHRSNTAVGLRQDIRSFNSARPCLIVEGNLTGGIQDSLHNCGIAEGYPITWDATSGDATVRTVLARLVFPFSDIVCIFAADFASHTYIIEFLLDCINLGAASTLPTPVRPRIVIVFESTDTGAASEIEEAEVFYKQLSVATVNAQRELFSALNIVRLDGRLSEIARYKQLSALIAGQLDDMTMVRQDHKALFNARHLVAFFQSAREHFLEEAHLPFNFVKATRTDRPVATSLSAHLAHYQEAAMLAGVDYGQLAPSIASALLMDHYRPGIPGKLTNCVVACGG
jgi:hypothetical protein